jgi:hypothetical protein
MTFTFAFAFGGVTAVFGCTTTGVRTGVLTVGVST